MNKSSGDEKNSSPPSEGKVMADNENNSQDSGKKLWVKAEAIFQVGATLVFAPVVGYFIGSFLDSEFHTRWIEILGLLMGIAGGFVHLFRVVGREE